MITAGLMLLFLAGLLLGALFSGSETGFYRVPRIRLVIDAVGGDRIARGLLWLSANPTLFVATMLVGNNLAHYFVTLAVVTLMHRSWPAGGATLEIIASIAIAPVVLVYGELLPKSLFYHAPNRLLRPVAPLLLLCTVLFMPVSAVLWATGKLLEWLFGESPQVIKRRLARAELSRVFEEGHEAGILRPAQRAMAQGLFAVAKTSIRAAMTPVGRALTIREGTPKEEVLRLARRHHLTVIPVVSAAPLLKPLGYIRIVDLYLSDRAGLGPIRPLTSIPENEPHVTALVRMQGANLPLARVVDAADRTLGYVTLRQLTEPLLRGGAA